MALVPRFSCKLLNKTNAQTKLFDSLFLQVTSQNVLNYRSLKIKSCDSYFPKASFSGGKKLYISNKLIRDKNADNRKYTTLVDLDDGFIFRQVLEYRSYTYTYLLGCRATGQAVLVDPVVETVARDLALVQQLGLTLVLALNTHVHADHVTGTAELRRRAPGLRSVISANSGAQADVKLQHGDTLDFGRYTLEARATPGHTDGCMSYVVADRRLVMTGDTLLIRGCGRTDFQQGCANTLYDSVHNHIFTLPDDYKVFPAHDYTGQTSSTVGEEKRHNPRLTRPRHDFIRVMDNLNLPYPKQIDTALPANLMCGVFDTENS